MEVLTIKFQELWDDFISSFKGNLIIESKKQDISFPLVKLTLTEAISTWLSEYTINGRWLYKLTQDDPEKGKLVKEIIIKDISLVEIKSNGPDSSSAKYLAPIGAGALGYGAAKLLGLATVGTACATVIPMIVAYPVAAQYISGKKDANQEQMINGYVNQLEKYKKSIISVLLA